MLWETKTFMPIEKTPFRCTDKLDEGW